jgi:predicted phage terminase large subunit-like protein
VATQAQSAELTQEELKILLQNLDKMPVGEQQQLLSVVEELESRRKAKAARLNLLDFAQMMMPEYKIGPHHRKLAHLLEDMAHGRKSRVTVSIAPRMGKSQLTSIFFPAWFIGNFPAKKIMMVSHTADLAVDFGRKVRNLVNSEEYKQIFPDVSLAADSKSAGRWDTNKGGTYFAIGIGGAIAGRGADLLVIDDPHNEQDILNGNFEVFEKAYEWYAYGARTRLMPGGAVAVVATRWAEQDLIGKLQTDMIRNPESDQWDVVEFPALFERPDAPASAPEADKYTALWPEQWPVEALLKTKASMPGFQWAAQYLQQPTSRDAAIIKREWWQEWDRDDPPQCEYIIMSLDAAAEKNNRADYTALTTWGVFYMDSPETGRSEAQIILLNSIKERLEFPELKRLAYDEYSDWQPDWFVVEKKSAGTALYQEMRRAGIPVQEITPTRASGDKVARLNAVSDIFASGMVWYPAGRRWSEEVVDEVCGFPAMPHDDLVDSTIYALMRFRDGGFIRLPTDSWEEEHDYQPVRAAYY